MSIKILSKITVQKIGCDPDHLEEIVTKNAGETVIMRVVGSVDRLESKTTDLGPYVCFRGAFSATNSETGDKYRSGKLILPSIAESILEPMVADVKATDPSGRVKFAFDITVERNTSKKAGKKYTFGVRSLLDSSEKDELTVMEESLPKMISAPVPKKK
jgi:hypothetical protein